MKGGQSLVIVHNANDASRANSEQQRVIVALIRHLYLARVRALLIIDRRKKPLGKHISL